MKVEHQQALFYQYPGNYAGSSYSYLPNLHHLSSPPPLLSSPPPPLLSSPPPLIPSSNSPLHEQRSLHQMDNLTAVLTQHQAARSNALHNPSQGSLLSPPYQIDTTDLEHFEKSQILSRLSEMVGFHDADLSAPLLDHPKYTVTETVETTSHQPSTPAQHSSTATQHSSTPAQHSSTPAQHSSHSTPTQQHSSSAQPSTPALQNVVPAHLFKRPTKRAPAQKKYPLETLLRDHVTLFDPGRAEVCEVKPEEGKGGKLVVGGLGLGAGELNFKTTLLYILYIYIIYLI